MGETTAGLLELRVEQEFEECLRMRWDVAPALAQAPRLEYEVEMTLDHSQLSCRDAGKPPAGPAEGAMVKRVPMGRDREAFVQNMPTGRDFLVAVVAKRPGRPDVRSPWVRASTLSDKARDADLGSIDPMNKLRTTCKKCPCTGYVPLRWSLNSPAKLRCRRCGCLNTDHTAVEVQAILKAREEKACVALRRKKVEPLPSDALEWDTRECSLWFWTDGIVNPRQAKGEHQEAPPTAAASSGGGATGLGGLKGRVSVVTPTTESRRQFHHSLWKCFEAQSWHDKELVVVETFVDTFSAFFYELARRDPRVVYVKYKRPRDEDWSIGLKRNIGAHLATGEFIANFDDDDLYAPGYLSAMLALLEDQTVQAATLSSWYIYDQPRNMFCFCDPIAWGLARGLDETSHEVRSKAYGYGFSYVFRRKAGLDVWYDDINMGEDYQFVSYLLSRRGKGCVALFHDDFGICLHVQHGGNTSNSIPLREVERDEALDLDIMELAPSFVGARASAFPGGLLAAAAPPSARERLVLAHTPEGEVKVRCAVNATASTFLERLAEQSRPPESNREEEGNGAGTLSPPSELQVFRVRPDGEDAEGEAWLEAAIEVLGLGFLADMPEAEHNLNPHGKCGRQWRQLLQAARRPMRGWERLGLRTRELWARPLAKGSREAPPDDEEKQEEFITVDVTCQKSTVKQFFSVSGAFQARLPARGDVAMLRWVLGRDLPPKARVMEERPGEDLVLLRDSDRTPEKVVVTDFQGRRHFYTKLTLREILVVLEMIRNFFLLQENQEKVNAIKKAAAGDESRYSTILAHLLAEEVFPPILRRLRLPDDQQPLQLLMDAMELVGTDADSMKLWLETEILMQTSFNIKNADRQVA